MKIFIGADHRGVALKKTVSEYLKGLGYTVEDVGAFSSGKPCDYPPIAADVASRVAKSRNSRGILVCMSGIGLSIAANKVKGAYAALCYNEKAAKLSRQHNNANILVLGAAFVTQTQMKRIIRVWLKEPFEGGRHARRLRKIQAIEKHVL